MPTDFLSLADSHGLKNVDYEALAREHGLEDVESDTAFGSFLRGTKSKALSGLGGLGGTLLGGAFGGLFTGPAAVAGSIAGGVAGAGLGSGAGEYLYEGIMGDEGLQREKAQIAANELAGHGFSSGAGQMLPALLPAMGSPTRAVGVLGRVASAAESGLKMGAAGEASRQVETGKFDPAALITHPIEEAIKFGPVGLIPHAQGILKSIAKGVPDAAVLTLSSNLYDHFAHGKPLSLEGYATETGESIPSFLLLNAITSLAHAPFSARAGAQNRTHQAPPATGTPPPLGPASIAAQAMLNPNTPAAVRTGMPGVPLTSGELAITGPEAAVRQSPEGAARLAQDLLRQQQMGEDLQSGLTDLGEPSPSNLASSLEQRPKDDARWTPDQHFQTRTPVEGEPLEANAPEAGELLAQRLLAQQQALSQLRGDAETGLTDVGVADPNTDLLDQVNGVLHPAQLAGTESGLTDLGEQLSLDVSSTGGPAAQSADVMRAERAKSTVEGGERWGMYREPDGTWVHEGPNGPLPAGPEASLIFERSWQEEQARKAPKTSDSGGGIPPSATGPLGTPENAPQSPAEGKESLPETVPHQSVLTGKEESVPNTINGAPNEIKETSLALPKAVTKIEAEQKLEAKEAKAKAQAEKSKVAQAKSKSSPKFTERTTPKKSTPAKADVKPSPKAESKPTTGPDKPAVQESKAVSPVARPEQARVSEAAKSTSSSLEAPFKAELPKKWTEADKEHAWRVVSGGDTKDLPPIGSKLGPAMRAWDKVREPATQGERREEAKKLLKQRDDDLAERKAKAKEERASKRSDAKKSLGEKDVSADKLNEIKAKEGESGNVQFSSAQGDKPAGINSFHVEKVKRALAVTKEGRFVLDRVEVYENPEQAAKALGVKPEEVGESQGVFQTKSGRSAVILSNVKSQGKESPSDALRRVMVHEVVGHGGLQALIKLHPEFERDLLPHMDKVRSEGWTYRDGEGKIRSLLEEYPELDPLKAKTTEEKAVREDRLFQEWFARSLESSSPAELAAGKTPTTLQKVWDAFVLVISRMLGRPYASRETQQFAYDMAKQIFAHSGEFAEPTVEGGGKVLASEGEKVQSTDKLEQEPQVKRLGQLLASAPYQNASAGTQRRTRGLMDSIADFLAKPGQRTASGLLKGRSKMGVVSKVYHDVVSNPVDEAYRVHPVIGAAMEHADYRTAQISKEFEARQNPAWEGVFRKLSPEQDRDLRLAYLRGDVPAQHAIASAVNPTDGVRLYEDSIQGFEQDYDNAVKAGLKLNKVGRYLPTSLKSGKYPELVSILQSHGMYDDILKVLNKTPDQVSAMDDFEAGDMIQGALRNMIKGAGSKHLKSRTGVAIDPRVMDEISDLYERFDKTIPNYGLQLTDAITRSEILGPDSIESFKEFMGGQRAAVDSETSPLGLAVSQLSRAGELDPHDLPRVKELFNARFGYLPDRKIASWLKSGNMALALGNPFAAIKQPAVELVKSLWHNGVIPTLIGVKKALKGEGIDPQRDLNLSPDFEIAAGNDPLKRYNQAISKMSGFRKADLFPAKAIGNAFLENLRRMSQTKRMEVLEHLKGFLSGPDKDISLQEVSNKIAQGVHDDPDVWRVAWHGITSLRPTGIGTQPMGQVRSNASLNRVAFNLKGWGLRNMNSLKEGIYDNLRSGDAAAVKQGLGQLSVLVTGMVIAGAAGDALVDWLLGRDVKLPEKVEDNLLKLALGSRYQLNQIAGTKPSLKDAALGYLSTPTVSLIDSAWGDMVKAVKDDEKSFMDIALKDKQLARLVPLGAGTAAQAWWGAGGEEDRAKALERRIPDSVTQLTEEHSKLEGLKEEGRKKRPAAKRRYEALSDFQKVKSYRVKRAKEAASEQDFEEAQAQLDSLSKLGNSPSLWRSEAERVKRLEAARKRLHPEAA